MPWTDKPKQIIGTLVASDGGSLALEVEQVDGKVEFLFLSRSIVARATDAFGALTWEQSVLSNDEVMAIIGELEQLSVVGEQADAGMVENFIGNLKLKYRRRNITILGDNAEVGKS